MITYAKAENLARTRQQIQKIEPGIDRTILKALLDNKTTARYELASDFDHEVIADVIAAKYKAAGWNAVVATKEARHGCRTFFIEFVMPTSIEPQPAPFERSGAV